MDLKAGILNEVSPLNGLIPIDPSMSTDEIKASVSAYLGQNGDLGDLLDSLEEEIDGQDQTFNNGPKPTCRTCGTPRPTCRNCGKCKAQVEDAVNDMEV